MTTTDNDDAIDHLATIHGRTWQHLKDCRIAAGVERERIRLYIEKLVPANCSFLVFGSLARDEFTSGSDVDWALLIDGAVSPRHLDVSQQIAKFLADKPPGPTQVFGCPIRDG